MNDITRQMKQAADAAAKRALAQALMGKLNDAASNLKLAGNSVRKGASHTMCMHLADAMVNLVEAGDMVDKDVMKMMFDRLKKIDRMQE